MRHSAGKLSRIFEPSYVATQKRARAHPLTRRSAPLVASSAYFRDGQKKRNNAHTWARLISRQVAGSATSCACGSSKKKAARYRLPDNVDFLADESLYVMKARVIVRFSPRASRTSLIAACLIGKGFCRRHSDNAMAIIKRF